jgi:hypothetical protein
VLSIYDFAAGTERPMCELGGTGESSFAVSADGSAIAFNWRGGIYVMNTAGLVDALRAGPVGCARLEERFDRVIECRSCFEPRWTGAAKLQYEEWDGATWRVRELDLAGASPPPDRR